MNQSLALKQFLALKKITPKPMRLAAEMWDAPWKTLIATLMSARTRDEVTILVAHDLFAKFPSVKRLASAKVSDIERVIRPVNFFRSKARHVHGCAKGLLEYDGIPPHDIELLTKLPGVGRKTANVFLSEFGHDAIGVDTHVFQISRYLAWSKSNEANKVESDLKELFPKKYWKDINTTLVRFGKTHTKRSDWEFFLNEVKGLK